MIKPLTSLVLIAAVAGMASAHANTVSPGSAAPKMDVKAWYKGQPVTSFDDNKLYVVEFWATWCGPCKQSIPHLTELAKANPDVTFTGISIWEDDNGKNIADFVKSEGEKMNYNVGYSGNQTGMAQTWMAAAGQNGIPTAFVIQHNKIEWIGHPMELEKPLAEIKAGKFDFTAFKADFDKKQAEQAAQMAAQKELQAIEQEYKDGKTADASTKLDALVKAHPEMAESAKMVRFGWLASSDPKAWEAQAKVLANSKSQQDRMQLIQFLMQDSRNAAHADEDRKAAGWLAANPENKGVIDLYYLGMVCESLKDYAGALDSDQKCLAALPTSQFKDNTDLIKMLTDKVTALKAKVNTDKGTK